MLWSVVPSYCDLFSNIIPLQRVEHFYADCSLVSEVALKNMGRDRRYETQQRANRVYKSWGVLETHVPYFGDIYVIYVYISRLLLYWSMLAQKL